MSKRNPREANSLKESIEYVCNVLAFYGIRYLNPEVFRQARLGNSEVSDRLWTGLFHLIVLHLRGFEIRINNPPQDMTLIPHITAYILNKWGCPVHFQSNSSQLQLLAFGWLADHTNLFQNYESNFSPSPTPFANIEELNQKAQEYLNENMPSPSTITPSTIVSIYRALLIQIRETFQHISYTAKLINQVHCADPSLDPEDLWVASKESRIQEFEVNAGINENLEKKKEENAKHRAVFWVWLDAMLKDIPIQNGMEIQKSEENLGEINEDVEEVYNEVVAAWRDIEGLLPRIRGKWSEVEETIHARLDENSLAEWQQNLDQITQELSMKFISLDEITEKLINSSNIPSIIPLHPKIIKDRSEGEELLLKKLPKLEQEFNKMQESFRSTISKSLQSIPGIRAYNL